VFAIEVEHSGSGKIWTRREHQECLSFLEEIDTVGRFISEFFAKVCVEMAMLVSCVLALYKLWDYISFMF
jgi:hypothetical protein